MKLSVIIPIYQSEATILRCVTSVEKALNRLYLAYLADTELILINDGSTDNSRSVCNALKRKYNNIINIHQPNAGVAAARNAGLEIAEGDLIAFVDSDDVVDEYYFKDLYQEMQTDTALVVSKPIKLKPDEKITKPITGKENRLRVIETPWDALDDFFGINGLTAVWGKMFRRKYIKNMFNPELNILEDMCFLADYLSNCKGCIRIVPKQGYIYYMKEDTKISFEQFQMLKKAYTYVAEIMEEAGCKEIDRLKVRYMNQFANNYLKLSPEEQKSKAGQELLMQFKEESQKLGQDIHLKWTETLLYTAVKTNPELAGSFVKQSRKSLNRINRTIS